jgi:GNAT superfamily N-acetyltransferase
VAGLVGWRRLLWVAPLWTCCRRYVAIEAPLASPAPSSSPVSSPEDADPPVAGGLEVEDLGLESLGELPRITPLVSLEEARRRLADGHACKLFRRGGKPVHYRWVALEPMRLPLRGLVFVPEPSDYVSLEVCTRPDARGGGIQSATVAWSTEHARQMGRTRKVAFVAWWNRPSLRAACRYGGFRVAGALTQWGIGPWRHNSATGRVRLEGENVRLAPEPLSEA